MASVYEPSVVSQIKREVQKNQASLTSFLRKQRKQESSIFGYFGASGFRVMPGMTLSVRQLRHDRTLDPNIG